MKILGARCLGGHRCDRSVHRVDSGVPREIDVAALDALMKQGARLLLLDVREPWEFGTAALPGSVLLPLGELAARADEVDPEAGALVVTICHHGVRSLGAAAFLERAGVADVVSLRGGIDAWSRLIDPSVPRY